MTNSEILAILKFLEDTRSRGLTALGVDARDPYWMMTIALLRRYYSKQRTTISSLAQSSGTAHATATRHIDRMIEAGLLVRTRTREEPKLVFIDPTGTLLDKFNDYSRLFKTKMGLAFGLDHGSEEDFVFGGAHLAARIVPRPSKMSPPLGLKSPLRILLINEPTFLVLERMKGELSTLLGSEIEITILDYEELNQKVIENGKASCSEYDLIAIDAPWLGRMAIEEIVMPIDNELSTRNLNPFDFYTAAWEAACCKGRHWGVMMAPTVELLLYRKDVLGEIGLEAPRTADEVVAVAKKVHNPNRSFFGISWNAAAGQPLGQTFIQVMAAFGSPSVNLNRYGAGYDLQTPWDKIRPTLNNEAGERTLEYLSELVDFSPPNIEIMDWNARTNAFRLGQTAMSYEWSGRTSVFEEDIASPARGNTGYAPHPTLDGNPGIAPMGGWLLGIPANIDPVRKRGALRALQWLATPEFTKCLIKNGSPARFLHSLDKDPDIPFPSPAQEVVASLERLGQVHLWPRPPVPYITTLMRVVGQEVHDVIWGSGCRANVLARAENRLKPLFESLHN
jgi:multiple sugar transport system substrate-binding protein